MGRTGRIVQSMSLRLRRSLLRDLDLLSPYQLSNDRTPSSFPDPKAHNTHPPPVQVAKRYQQLARADSREIVAPHLLEVLGSFPAFRFGQVRVPIRMSPERLLLVGRSNVVGRRRRGGGEVEDLVVVGERFRHVEDASMRGAR